MVESKKAGLYVFGFIAPVGGGVKFGPAKEFRLVSCKQVGLGVWPDELYTASDPIEVVIPTWNAAATLPDTLAPLVEGAGAGLIRELIVSDGGSSDDTCAIARAAGRPRRTRRANAQCRENRARRASLSTMSARDDSSSRHKLLIARRLP